MIGLEGSPEAQPPNRINLNGGIGIVIGNEGQGLRRLVRDKCDPPDEPPHAGAN